MSDTEDKEESLVSHIEALRTTLIKCFVSVGIVLPFAFYFSPKALNFMIKILISDNKITLNYFAPMEIFVLQIKLALLIAITLVFPYIVKNLWDFVVPALYEHERKLIRSTIVISSCLFISGIIFCLFFILPLIINFGISFGNSQISPVWGVSNLMNLSLTLAFTFGLMFQVPLITHALIRLGVISHEAVSSKRRYVIVILLIVSALLTPPDIVSQILMFIPTYLLFELGLLFSKKRESK